MRESSETSGWTAYASSRHALVSRRAVLRYGFASTAALALAACGRDDAVLRDVAIEVDSTPTTMPPPPGADTAPSSTAAPVGPSATDAAPSTGSSATSEVPPETSPTGAPGAVAVVPAVPADAEMIVGFTYRQLAGGKNASPYTAVWVEGVDGRLVHTIALWRKQGDSGAKYLRYLTRWYSVDDVAEHGGSPADVVSSATRFPGEYLVAWDGRVDGGQPLVAGDYFMCIESAREDGPHSLIRTMVTFDGSPIGLVLPDDAELIAASVSIA